MELLILNETLDMARGFPSHVRLSPWSTGLYDTAYGRLFHRPRLEQCLAACRNLNAARVLEVGCHDMLFYQLLGRQYEQFVGVDSLVWDQDLAELEIRDSWDGVSVLNSPAEKLPFEDDAFDLVLCFETLEHVEDEDAAVAEMVRVLQPGGTLLFSVPIEIGVLLPLKVLTRRLVRGTREYTWAELFNSTRGDVSRVSRDQHKGYDYRKTIARFQQLGLTSQSIQHLPSRWLPGWLNLGALVQMTMTKVPAAALSETRAAA